MRMYIRIRGVHPLRNCAIDAYTERFYFMLIYLRALVYPATKFTKTRSAPLANKSNIKRMGKGGWRGGGRRGGGQEGVIKLVKDIQVSILPAIYP